MWFLGVNDCIPWSSELQATKYNSSRLEQKMGFIKHVAVAPRTTGRTGELARGCTADDDIETQKAEPVWWDPLSSLFPLLPWSPLNLRGYSLHNQHPLAQMLHTANCPKELCLPSAVTTTIQVSQLSHHRLWVLSWHPLTDGDCVSEWCPKSQELAFSSPVVWIGLLPLVRRGISTT